MANFKIAYDRTNAFEGIEYDQDRNDPGAWTGNAIGSGNFCGSKGGVTAHELGVYLGRTATASDMKNMSEETHAAIFKTKYWDYMHGDQITDQDEANSFYDVCINEGDGEGILVFARSLLLPDNSTVQQIVDHLNNKGE